MFTAMLNIGTKNNFSPGEINLFSSRRVRSSNQRLHALPCHIQHMKWAAAQREENHSPQQFSWGSPKDVTPRLFHCTPGFMCMPRDRGICPRDVSSLPCSFQTKSLLGFCLLLTAVSVLATFSCERQFHLSFLLEPSGINGALIRLITPLAIHVPTLHVPLESITQCSFPSFPRGK